MQYSVTNTLTVYSNIDAINLYTNTINLYTNTINLYTNTINTLIVYSNINAICLQTGNTITTTITKQHNTTDNTVTDTHTQRDEFTYCSKYMLLHYSTLPWGLMIND